MESSECLWLRGAIDSAALSKIDQIAGLTGSPGTRPDWVRPEIAEALAPVTELIRGHALSGARLTRLVWFSKDESVNWGVPWHQDRIIAVGDRHDLSGFHNWSQKAGIWYCEPPITVFSDMRFVRLHLDDCDAENGAMEIALGSERRGAVPEADAAKIASEFPPLLCQAKRGDIQILPMLVLHRSRPSRTTAPRRALRIDYSGVDLPHPMQWRLA